MEQYKKYLLYTYLQFATTLNYLDEGSHTFSVKGRYLSGYEEAVADSVSFIINAVTGPALRIAPLYKETTYGDLFSIDIMAEDLVNVAGVEVLLLFDVDGLSLISGIFKLLKEFFLINLVSFIHRVRFIHFFI